jgi:hypothetical protein
MHCLLYASEQYTTRPNKTTIDLETSMETLGVTTQNEQYRKTAGVRVNTRGLKGKTSHLHKGTRVFFLSLVYILNGNHDPKKVQRLNLFLVSIFFMVGLFLDQGLLPFGFAFLGIALVNGINVWVVQNLSDHLWNPVEREITVQIHHSLQKYSTH